MTQIARISHHVAKGPLEARVYTVYTDVTTGLDD